MNTWKEVGGMRHLQALVSEKGEVLAEITEDTYHPYFYRYKDRKFVTLDDAKRAAEEEVK